MATILPSLILMIPLLLAIMILVVIALTTTLKVMVLAPMLMMGGTFLSHVMMVDNTLLKMRVLHRLH